MIYPELGYIGQFHMTDATTGKQQLLDYINQLKEQGHSKIVAPINGSTWQSYRLVSFSDDTISPFPKEPDNPLWYNEVYKEVGFTPLHTYYSEIFHIGYGLKFNRGLDIRQFSPADFKAIYEIASVSFQDNFMFSPISYEDFAQLYGRSAQAGNDSDYIALAYVDNKPVGFIFSYVFNNALVLKTMAVLPEYRSLGIGAGLINHVCTVAKENGVKKAIGALISSGNHSGKIVSKYGSKVFREYTLYTYTS